MSEAPKNRVTDQGIAAVAADTVKVASRAGWDWFERRNIPAHAVMLTTLWLTFESMFWAMSFAENYPARSGAEIAMITGAVLTPWGLMQGFLGKFYLDLLKARQNGNSKP